MTSTILGPKRGTRSLGLLVVNPDLSSDESDDGAPVQPRQDQQQTRPLPVPRPPIPTSVSNISITTSNQSTSSLPFIGARAMSPTTRAINPASNYYISSPSSRSSPAPDTTPSPSTPSSSAPPLNPIGEDKPRWFDGLGLNVADQSDTELQYNQNRPRPENVLQDVRNLASSNQPRSQSAAPPLAQSATVANEPVRRGSFDRLIITATADTENHVIVDITGARDAAFIRERMFTKLHIPDEEQPYFSIYRTELGEQALGDALTDDQLMIYCEAFADAKGTLKFLVQRSAFQGNHSRGGSSLNMASHSPPIPVPPTPPQYTTPFSRPTRPATRSAGEGSMSSASGDRLPWDRVSNGYEQSTSEDSDMRGRLHWDTPRRRDHSLSSSDSRSLTSPTSPTTSNVSVAPLVAGHEARKGIVTATPLHLMSSLNHRRERSDAAAEREHALEATERFRENQSKEYDAQMRRMKQKQRIGDTRQGLLPRSENSESRPMSGWVLVDPVPQTSNPSDQWSNNSPPAGSRPSQSQQVSRPYPHSTGPSLSQSPSYSSQLTSSRFPSTPGASLSRSPNVSASTTKYLASGPPRSGIMGPPPGASDPKMAQFDSRNPTPPTSQFYPIPTTPYGYAPSGRAAPQRLSPQDAPRLASARSIPELRGAARPPQTQLPVGNRKPPPSPQAYGMPTGSTRGSPHPPGSPHRLPPTSPGRAAFSPGAYAVPAPSSRGSAMEQGRILASNRGPFALQSKQSFDRASPLLPTPEETASSLPPNGSSLSSNPRYGVQLSGMQPQPRGDEELAEGRNRPSPSDSATPADALYRLEAGRRTASGQSISPAQDRSSPRGGPASIPSQTVPTIISTSSTDDTAVGTAADLSPSASSTSTPSTTTSTIRNMRDSEEDTTLKGDNRDYYLQLLNLGEGTIVPGSQKQRRGGTLKRRVPSIRKDIDRVSLAESVEVEEFEDEYYSEDEDDEIFWQPIQKNKQPVSDEASLNTTAPLNIPGTRLSSESDRPALKVQIGSIPNGQSSNPRSARSSSSRNDKHLNPDDLPINSGAITPINRRASFRRDTWAFRPSAEDVYDRLQDFFPNHDLDKTFVETTVPPEPTPAEPTPAPTPTTPSAKFRHRKSIRYVAEEGKRALERQKTAKVAAANAANATSAANITRKRSTKLWGLKVEEVTPRDRSGPPSAIPESPTAAPAKATMKWIKGELIGKGSFGRVYLAMNATNGEMMAVKQVEMPQTISDRDDARQIEVINALKAERATLETLDHPNVVQYLGFEQTTEYFSLFLEYVSGGSIGTRLQKQGKFQPDIIKYFTSQILDGLSYLHANKIIHRDVKAENILVDQNGICKISDFGISRRSVEEIYANAAMTAMKGTVFWMAPEIIHNAKKGYNAKIDIWSLGCVFLEMWAGRRPWGELEPVAVMYQIFQSKAAPPVPDDVHLDEAADDFRLKCFAINPDDRPTAEQLRYHRWLALSPGWQYPRST